MDDKYLEWERECYMRRVNRRRTRGEKQRRKNIARTLFLLGIIALLIAALVFSFKVKATEKRLVIVNEVVVMPELYDEEEPALISLGEFKVTHYCGGECCCGEYADGITATGTQATEGRTIAVDPSVIPYGTEVAVFYDDGRICYYTAEDCGGAIRGNHIDVFINEHDRALELGVMSASVYIVNEVA